MTNCKHEFAYNEQLGEAVCTKCGYVVTAEDKKEAIAHAFKKMRWEEAVFGYVTIDGGDGNG